MERTKIYYLHYGNNVPIYVGKTVRVQGRIGAHRSKFGQNIILEVVDNVLTSADCTIFRRRVCNSLLTAIL